MGLGSKDLFDLNLDIEEPDAQQQYILSQIPVNEQWSYTMGAVYKHFSKNSFQTFVLSRSHFNNSAYKYLDNDDSSEENKIIDFGCFVKWIGKIDKIFFYDVKLLDLSPRTWIWEEMGKRKNLFPRTNALFIVFIVHKYCYLYMIYIDLIHKRDILTNALGALINNLFKESFY